MQRHLEYEINASLRHDSADYDYDEGPEDMDSDAAECPQTCHEVINACSTDILLPESNLQCTL
jgi:hypothetical protein